MKKVAVITPSLPKRAGYLEECIESVKNQTYIKTVHYYEVDHERKGPVFMRNKLAWEAYCDYASKLVFLDDDDLIDPTFIEKMMEFSEDYEVVYPLWRVTGWTDWPVSHNCNYQDLENGNFIPMTAMVDMDMWVKVGGFDEGDMEDWVLWVKILRAGGKFKCIHEQLWTYRFHQSNRTPWYGRSAGWE